MTELNTTIEALIDIGTIIGRVIEKAVAKTNLSPPQLRILLYVKDSTSVTPSELAALLLQETHSVSGLLNRLEDRDLIVRTRDREDRRVVHVSLSLEGRRVLAEATMTFAQAQKQLLDLVGASRSDEILTVKLRDDLLKLFTADHGHRRAMMIKRAQEKAS